MHGMFFNFNIENDHRTIHANGGHVSRILLVPPQTQQRRVWSLTLVNDRTVILVSQVENSHTSIRTYASENLWTTPRDVVHLLIMRDELRVHALALDVPNRTRRVDRRRPHSLKLGLVPIKARQRCAKFAALVIIQ